MAKREFETEAGKSFSEDLKSIDRSRAAERAASTRRLKRRKERDESLASRYCIYGFDDAYHGMRFDASVPIEEVVSDIISDITSDEPYSITLTESDLVVWLAYRVVAVIRKGPGGRPVGTIL